MQALLTIPVHNESETIENVISSFIKISESLGLLMDVQVIDDNSTDGTSELVRQMGITVHRVINGTGLADAFRTEMIYALATKADYFIHVDGDGQHLASDLPAFLEKMFAGDPLILGNRLHTKPPGMSEVRFDANILLSRIVSSLAAQPISDSQTGYRVIRRDVAESCKIMGSYTYTQEQILRASHNGYIISEVPINVNERTSGASRLVKSPITYLSRVFRDLENIVETLGCDFQ